MYKRSWHEAIGMWVMIVDMQKLLKFLLIQVQETQHL